MALTDLRLALMTFPQRWDANAKTLDVTVLVVPSGDPTQPLFPASPGTAAFAAADVRLRVALVPGLAALPSLASPSDALTLARPPGAAELFTQFVARYAPVDTTTLPPAPVPAPGILRKALPDTYLAQVPPGGRRSPYLAGVDDFGCAVRGQDPTPVPTSRPAPAWGELISHSLRNPVLATALGLRYRFTIPVEDPAPFATGGWLFVTLDDADGGTGYAAAWTATPDAVKTYAARIPTLGAETRAVFSAVLFPVANPAATPTTPDESALDEAFIEAEAYDDGFAKLVHARQPDSIDAHVGDGARVGAATDVGIQVGWDDEQILLWHNRQIEIANQALTGAAVPLEAPLGVIGYRLDVREPVPGEPPADRNLGWVSLMQATGTPPPPLDQFVGTFSGELVVEPTASAPAAAERPGEFWLPLYFAQWTGTPIGVRDDTPHLLAGGVAAGKQPPVLPSAFVGADIPPLRYGHTYELRVRLGDLSGGGPDVLDLPVNETVAERARVAFARYVTPNAFRLGTDTPTTELTITRPAIGYPEALFTERYGSRPDVRDATRSAMLAQLGLAADGTPLPPDQRVPDTLSIGVPDPDVDTVEIRVEVRALAHDTGDDVSDDGVFITLYTTTRPLPPLAALPAAGVTPLDVVADVAVPPLTLAFADVAVVTPGAPVPGSGPLPVPRARDVRIVLTPIASGPPGYFGSIDPATGRSQPTRGASAHVQLRSASSAEPAPLFAPPLDGRPAAQAFYFQPVTSGDPVAAMMGALAGALDVEADGLTLRARPGRRVAFGAAAGVSSTIAPDGSSLTFNAAADVFRRWTVALRYDLDRDWTWDGLRGGQVAVQRGGAPIGTVDLPRVASAASLAAPSDRERTRLVFLDAIDPAVPDAADGYSARPPYVLTATIPIDGGPDLIRSTDPVALELPVVVPPSAVPRLVSAGYALSPYQPAADYASTSVRTRRLWLEFDRPPEPGDSLFARVLAYAPDPLLYVDTDLLRDPPPQEPGLPLDPESMRVITPGQPRDTDGLEAMVALVGSPTDPTRFLLPLPDGVADDDPRLFGLWTYEFRYGHVAPWSTAHGRFGRPLRVTGVQHPAPVGGCAASWRALPEPGNTPARDVVATAPYATPVLDGRQVGDGIPRTTLGFLLYAQGRQSDASGNRNVLLAHHGAQLLVDQERVTAGQALFSEQEIDAALAQYGLPPDAHLSVLAVEFYRPGGSVGTEYQQQLFRSRYNPVRGARDVADLRRIADAPQQDPFGSDFFGQQRILRTSPLARVQPVC